MNKSRLDIVKETFLKRSHSIEDEKENMLRSASIQTTYIRRLQNDIKITTSFINQTDIAIDKLGLENHNNLEDMLTLKKDIIALSDIYSRLPYLPDKGDVIGIASASSIISNLIEQQTEVSKYLGKKNETDEDEIIVKKSLLGDYSKLLHLIDQKTSTAQSRLNDIRKKTNELSLTQVTKSLQDTALTDRINEALQIENVLASSLKRILIKHLALGDWQHQQVMTESSFQEGINDCLQLIESLVNSLLKSITKDIQQEWVVVYANVFEEKLINQLLMSGLVISREDSSSGKYILKLRNFGVEF